MDTIVVLVGLVVVVVAGLVSLVQEEKHAATMASPRVRDAQQRLCSVTILSTHPILLV